MKNKKSKSTLLIPITVSLILIALFTTACSKDDITDPNTGEDTPTTNDTIFEATDWSSETHSKDMVSRWIAFQGKLQPGFVMAERHP